MFLFVCLFVFHSNEQEYEAGNRLRALRIDNDGALAAGTNKHCVKPNTYFSPELRQLGAGAQFSGMLFHLCEVSFSKCPLV